MRASDLLCASSLVLFLFNINVDISQAEQPVRVEDPYDAHPTVRARRLELDRTRWLYKMWSHSLPMTYNPEGKPIEKTTGNRTVTEVVEEIVGPEKFAALRNAFDRRVARAAELQREIAWFEIEEERAYHRARGASQQMLDQRWPVPSGWTTSSEEDSVKALVKYKRAQDEAEAEWAEEIDEI